MRFAKTVLLIGLVSMFILPASDAGASPFSRIETVLGTPNGIGGNAAGTAFAQCPAGEQLVGGGGYWPSGSATNLTITRSIPLVESNGWIVTGRNWSGTARELRASAQCGIPKSGGGFASTFTQTSSGSFTGGGGQNLEEVGCPAGTQLLSGGGFWDDFNRSQLGFVENDPSSGWTVIGRNWSSSGAKVFAVALCGVPGPSGGFSEFFQYFGSPWIRVFAGQVGNSLGLCAAGSQVIGVGGVWNAPASELPRGGGVALTAFGASVAPSQEFFAQGGNMASRAFEMVSKARCGT